LGYTVLVFDTNVILSCLAIFRSVVESAFYTAMIPLPVITELDGLSKQPAPLGTQAQEALLFLTTHIRSHSRSLKVQTSRGNYLSDLTIRSEDISFSFSNTYNPTKARNMDDLILRACTFQEEHFVDRTAILNLSRNVGADVKDQATKVVLLTNDRNLRLRAKAQGVMAVDEKPMRRMLRLAKDGTPVAASAG
jgi:protein SMG6